VIDVNADFQVIYLIWASENMLIINSTYKGVNALRTSSLAIVLKGKMNFLFGVPFRRVFIRRVGVRLFECGAVYRPSRLKMGAVGAGRNTQIEIALMEQSARCRHKGRTLRKALELKYQNRDFL
jgi:hypothetical protein